MSDRDRAIAVAQAEQLLRQALGPQFAEDAAPRQLTEEMIEALNILRIYAPAEYENWKKRVADAFPAEDGQQPITPETVDGFVAAVAGAGPVSPGDVAQDNADAQVDPQTSTGGLFGLGPPPPPPAEPGRVQAPPPLLGGVERVESPLDPADRKFAQPGFYRYGDQFQFQSSNPVAIRKLQKELEKAGLLEEGSYTPGFWDEPSAQAMQGAMGYANRGGTTWQSVVDRLKAIEVPRQRREFAKPPPVVKLMPDPASINQSVKARFRQALGREPTEEELHQYARQLSGLYAAAEDRRIAEEQRAFWEQNVQETQAGSTAQSVLDATFGALTGQPAPTIGGGTPEPRIIETIDPGARFAEAFEQRYGPEMRRNERVADLENTRQNVMESLLTMQGLIG